MNYEQTFTCGNCHLPANAIYFIRHTQNHGDICWNCYNGHYHTCLGCKDTVPVTEIAPLTNAYGGVIDRCQACRITNALNGSPLKETIQ